MQLTEKAMLVNYLQRCTNVNNEADTERMLASDLIKH